MHITRNEDGEITDTIATYILKRYVGGELDGEEVIGRDLKKSKISHGAEEGLTYVRKTHSMGPIRLVAFVDEFYPKVKFWPYEVWRRIAKGHPELMQVTKAEAEKTE